MFADIKTMLLSHCPTFTGGLRDPAMCWVQLRTKGVLVRIIQSERLLGQRLRTLSSGCPCSLTVIVLALSPRIGRAVIGTQKKTDLPEHRTKAICETKCWLANQLLMQVKCVVEVQYLALRVARLRKSPVT